MEIYGRLKRLRSGIDCAEERWLEEVIEQVGPEGNFLAQRSTSQALRGGEWQTATLGFQGTYEAWQQTQPDILAEGRGRRRTRRWRSTSRRRCRRK